MRRRGWAVLHRASERREQAATLPSLAPVAVTQVRAVDPGFPVLLESGSRPELHPASLCSCSYPSGGCGLSLSCALGVGKQAGAPIPLPFMAAATQVEAVDPSFSALLGAQEDHSPHFPCNLGGA